MGGAKSNMHWQVSIDDFVSTDTHPIKTSDLLLISMLDSHREAYPRTMM